MLIWLIQDFSNIQYKTFRDFSWFKNHNSSRLSNYMLQATMEKYLCLTTFPMNKHPTQSQLQHLQLKLKALIQGITKQKIKTHVPLRLKCYIYSGITQVAHTSYLGYIFHSCFHNSSTINNTEWHHQVGTPPCFLETYFM